MLTDKQQGAGGQFSTLARQLGYFLLRPRVWPDLWRWLLRRAKVRILGRDAAAEEARLVKQESAAWCAARVQTPVEALNNLGFTTNLIDLQASYPHELLAAAERVKGVPFKLGGASNMDLVFTFCEALQATRVIETGVANGWSSLAILLSLAKRPGAALHSIDTPYLKYQNDRWVGIAVPQELSGGWTLHRMADRQGLPKALEALGAIDLAHYDSDKSEAGRRFAYPLLWRALRPGGILFSDDVDDNYGFRDFCDSVRQTPVIVRQGNKFQGILRKPSAPATG